MKTSAFLPSLASAMLLALATDCHALTPLEENFSGTTLDTTLWQLAQFENARLTQNNRLNFLIGPATHPEEDYAYLELRNNHPSYNENWQVIVDVSNTTGQQGDVGLGFWIYSIENTSNVLFFEFYGNKSKMARTSVEATFLETSTYLADSLKFKKKATSGKLKVTFSARTKLFTFDFGMRVPKKSGKGTTLVWHRMGTFSTTGKGGNVRANWGMNDTTSSFGIRLEGFGENKLVGAGQAYMDNFVLRTPK